MSLAEDLFLHDGEHRIRIVREWAFIPAGLYQDRSLHGPTIFELANHILCPSTVNGGTDERPQDGYIKRWPSLAELTATIGKTERSTKKALRKLEQLGYVSVEFHAEENEPNAEIGIHSFKDKPAIHKLSLRGEAARDAWRTFRGGQFPNH